MDFLSMQEIYTRVESLLTEKHLRKVDLSRDTGISDASIRSWASGVIPNVINAYKVASYLGISVESLITGHEDKPETTPPQSEPSVRLSYMETQLLERFNKLDDRDRDVLLSLADVLQKKYRGLYTTEK